MAQSNPPQEPKPFFQIDTKDPRPHQPKPSFQLDTNAEPFIPRSVTQNHNDTSDTKPNPKKSKSPEEAKIDELSRQGNVVAAQVQVVDRLQARVDTYTTGGSGFGDEALRKLAATRAELACAKQALKREKKVFARMKKELQSLRESSKKRSREELGDGDGEEVS